MSVRMGILWHVTDKGELWVKSVAGCSSLPSLSLESFVGYVNKSMWFKIVVACNANSVELWSVFGCGSLILLGWMRKLQRKGTVMWRSKKIWRNTCVFIYWAICFWNQRTDYSDLRMMSVFCITGYFRNVNLGPSVFVSTLIVTAGLLSLLNISYTTFASTL
jgi:hypothetical protein